MTESTLMQTTENNNTTAVKMEPPVSPSPSEQQYSLKWNDFQTSILSSFRHLRDEEDFVDVTLACDRRSFTAHKVVLSACSPYFRKLLKANPCEHPIVILRDVRAEDVESLLRFMYNGEVHIGHEQISDFLKTAQLLQVRGLADVTGAQSRTSNSTVSSALASGAATAASDHKALSVRKVTCHTFNGHIYFMNQSLYYFNDFSLDKHINSMGYGRRPYQSSDTTATETNKKC